MLLLVTSELIAEQNANLKPGQNPCLFRFFPPVFAGEIKTIAGLLELRQSRGSAARLCALSDGLATGVVDSIWQLKSAYMKPPIGPGLNVTKEGQSWLRTGRGDITCFNARFQHG